MKVQNLVAYVRLGELLPILTVDRPGREVAFLRKRLKVFMLLLNEMPLPVTAILAAKLSRVQKALEGKPDEEAIGPDIAKECYDIMLTVLPPLRAEAGVQAAHIVTSDHYDANRLLDDVGALMREGLLATLPEIAQYDLSQAGRCLAFELPTAAAFHSLRAVEAVLRRLYEGLVSIHGLKLLEEWERTWGKMVSALKELKPKDESLARLLDELGVIGRNYRNRTDHPKDIYDMHQAYHIFNLCKGAVDIIERYRKNKESVGLSTVLIQFEEALRPILDALGGEVDYSENQGDDPGQNN